MRLNINASKSKLIKAILANLILLVMIGYAHAADNVVFGEVLVNPSGTDSGSEFIELYNPTDSDINIGSWKINFKSSSNLFPRAIPSGSIIPAQGFFLITNSPASSWPSSWAEPDIRLAYVLTNSGMGLQLEDSTGSIVDRLGWGSELFIDDYFETNPLPQQFSSGSLERKPGFLDSLCGNWIDTNDNVADFLSNSNPEPQSTASGIEKPCNATPDITPPATISNLQAIDITADSIRWAWTNPSDPDFLENIIFVNGVNLLNDSTERANIFNLNPDTDYTIIVHTKDLSGNVNADDVSDTARTLANAQGCSSDEECSDGLFCNGQEACIDSICQKGIAVVCEDSLFCNGQEVCNEDTDSCESGAAVECDDNLFCNGVETCNEDTDSCESGAAVDCSQNNLPEINTCNNDPDDNEFTLDLADSFVSLCDESTDLCSVGNQNVGSSCSIDFCGAICETDADCSQGFKCEPESCGCVLSGEPFCGDEVKNLEEECDSSDIGNLTCADFGFDDGFLACDGLCLVNTSNCFDLDTDEDGILDADDNCPLIANENQEDSDNDSLGDVCDSCANDADNDIDQDAVCGDVDNCPLDANEGQNDNDGDGAGNACDDDDDNDGFSDDVDNCPLSASINQTDSDNDGLGDACDVCPEDPDNDADSDGICGNADFCPFDAENDADEDEICGDIDVCPQAFNPSQEDSDEDGVGDACDICLNDPLNDVDNDEVCGDIDFLIGNSGSIRTNMDCLSFSLNNQTNMSNYNGTAVAAVRKCGETYPILEFNYNFGVLRTLMNISNQPNASNNTGVVIKEETSRLDLSKFNITVNRNGTNSMIIRGLNLTGNATKTAYMDIVLGTNSLCIIDDDVTSITVEGDCDNGVKITCDGSNSQYSCEKVNNNTLYKISGLKHSAVAEYSFTEPTPAPSSSGGSSGGGGGGGGGGCTYDWACTDWSSCDDGNQTRACTNSGTCRGTLNKPAEARECTVEVQLEPVQVTGLAEEKPKNENASKMIDNAEAVQITGAAVADEPTGNKNAVIATIILIAAALIFAGRNVSRESVKKYFDRENLKKYFNKKGMKYIKKLKPKKWK